MPAEIVIPYNTETEFCEDEKMCSLVDYINDVFHLPAISEIESPISEVFNEKTSNTKYRSPRGQVCRITSLYNDFADFYKGLFVEIPEQWKVHKILTGQRFDFFEVVLLGFFLGIEPQDYQGETKSEKTRDEDNLIGKRWIEICCLRWWRQLIILRLATSHIELQ